MAKIRWAVASRRRRKRLLKKAKGYTGARGKHLRRAKETVMRAQAYATRDRKARKREFRSLWIIRLNAAARSRGLVYRDLMAALRRSGVGLNRKQLSELALQDPAAFDTVLATALEQPAASSRAKHAASAAA